jgi:hypothetical protein
MQKYTAKISVVLYRSGIWLKSCPGLEVRVFLKQGLALVKVSKTAQYLSHPK